MPIASTVRDATAGHAARTDITLTLPSATHLASLAMCLFEPLNVFGNRIEVGHIQKVAGKCRLQAVNGGRETVYGLLGEFVVVMRVETETRCPHANALVRRGHVCKVPPIVPELRHFRLPQVRDALQDGLDKRPKALSDLIGVYANLSLCNEPKGGVRGIAAVLEPANHHRIAVAEKREVRKGTALARRQQAVPVNPRSPFGTPSQIA